MSNSLRTLALAVLDACLALPGAAQPAPGVLRWLGSGAQVYECREAGGAFAWAFVQPRATLADEQGVVRADHGAGPSWTAKDGSRIVGTVTNTIPAPPAARAIPWLVLRVFTHEGQGQLADVAFVLRTDTEGGLAPAAGCDREHGGTRADVPYRATYTFVAGPPG